MAAKLIVITRWEQHFETYESLRVKGPGTWVAVPTKHDGRSYRRLVQERDGASIYGAWCLLVQVAKKMPVRGVLADAAGPLTAEDLADKTLIPAKIFERMLDLVASERIGWAEIITDPAEISARLREVTQICTPRPRAVRDSPQTPADARTNGHSPADFTDSPADCGRSRELAGAPAASRTSPQTSADERTSRARAGEQDRTRQNKTTPPKVPPGGRESVPLGVLEETASFLCGLFGGKRTRLGQSAEHQLASWSDHLPLTAEQKKLLAWFYALPPDQENIDLRSRHGDADKLASNLFAALERAEAYKKKSGATFEDKKSAVPAPAPEGAWEWYAANYPDAPRPPTWAAVPESIRSQFSLERTVPA